MERPPEGGSTVVCTIVSKNYLSLARTLARSIAEHHDDVELLSLLVDEVEGRFDPGKEPFRVLLASELGIPSWEHMWAKYEITELNTAVKPYLLERLFEERNARKVLYFDPDIVVYRRLDQVLELLDEHGVVLTPHILEPLDDDRSPSELDFLRVGSYNLGFIGLSRRGPWRDLLRWWQSKVYRECTRELERGLFVDQHWMDLVPSLFESVHVLRDPGHNVAYWNFKNRPLERTDEGFAARGRPLVFFHFSGFPLDDPERVSRHQNRFTLSQLGDAYRTCFFDYRRRLEENGYAETSCWPYAYGRFADDTPITDVLRICLREHDTDATRWPSPERDGFVAWATSTAGQAGTRLLSPYALTLHALREDLRSAFPRVRSEDEEAYARWFVQQRGSSPIFHPTYVGPVERALEPPAGWRNAPGPGIWERLRSAVAYYRTYPERVAPFVPPEAIDVVPEVYTGPAGPYGWTRAALQRTGLLQMTRRLLGLRLLLSVRSFFERGRGQAVATHDGAVAVLAQPDESAPAAATGHAPRALGHGVNVVGFLDAETGVGEVARSVLRSLQAVGYPVAALPIRAFDTSRHADDTANGFSQGAPHRINLFNVNADMTGPVRTELGVEVYRGRHNVGYWFWELSRFPDRWLEAFEAYDEIWVGSSFVQAAVAERSPIPVVKMPVAVEVEVDESLTRRRLGLPEEAFLVLVVFDALSVVERKNPWAAIRAFEAAFSNQESRRARLVVKVTNLERYPDAAERLRGGLRRIDGVLIDRYLSRVETNALMRQCDAHLSLHRSEGLGLTIAEAMYLGKPVIATAYSGNTDFMAPDNSYMVPYRLVRLECDYPPYPRGYEWAEPDVEEAASLLRSCFDRPEEARQRGSRASERIRRDYGRETVGRHIVDRLELIRNRFARASEPGDR